jgi:D-glycero-alpha-D-manno-heptose-7-phosphate kinase
MFEIQVKSPTRVDISGGTLDCWPLYLFFDNPVTVNVAIDIFTHVNLRESEGPEIELKTEDMQAHQIYANLEDCLQDTNPAFHLVRAHLRFWQPQKGFYLETKSESPVGGGLGGSSSLCISLLKAFSSWNKKKFDPYEMVRIASHIEAQILGKPTGTQDYFPPIFGGLNFIHYEIPGPRVEVKALDRDLFRDRFLLVYTGKSHHSGINNWQVIKQWLDADEQTRGAMKKLADISIEMRSAVLASDARLMAEIFDQEYVARVDLSDGFLSAEIRKLAEIAKSEKAVAKICGAGGGGCVLVWCPDRQIASVRAAVEKAGFQTLPTQPWTEIAGGHA